MRRCEPLWRETGDGHGTTLVVTDAGLRAIGIEPIVTKTVVAICEHPAKAPTAAQLTQRSGTKQALLITMLQAAQGATIKEMMTVTGWQSHTVRGAMSGSLKKSWVFRSP